MLGIALVAMWRYEPDDPATVVGAWGDDRIRSRPARSWPMDEPTVAATLPETGRPARIEDFGDVAGTIADASAQDAGSAQAPARRSSSTATSGA